MSSTSLPCTSTLDRGAGIGVADLFDSSCRGRTYSGVRRTEREQRRYRLEARRRGGAATVISSLIGHGFGPKIGGLFLAFPAIFPLSATLLEKHQREEKHRARIASTSHGRLAAALDARGAMMGSLAGLAFAVMAWQLIPTTGLYPALSGALLVWILFSHQPLVCAQAPSMVQAGGPHRVIR